jgi:hypothetical protein
MLRNDGTARIGPGLAGAVRADLGPQGVDAVGGRPQPDERVLQGRFAQVLSVQEALQHAQAD